MSELTYIHKCHLCKAAGKKHPGFVAPSVAALLLDPNGQDALGKLIGNLALHLQTDHKEQFAATAIIGNEFAGFLRLCYFEMPDPAAFQMREWVRHKVFCMTRRFTIPDEKIVQQVTSLQLPEEYLERVIATVRTMRDLLEERGPFAAVEPGKPAPSVTAPPV